MKITLINRTSENCEKYLPMFRRIASSAEKTLGLSKNLELSVTFVRSRTIHQINRDCRGVDRPTDVISFAIRDSAFAGEMAEEEEDLGDLFLNIDYAEKQARAYGHSLKREVGFLFTHGMHFSPVLAPIKAAILPLRKNYGELGRKIRNDLSYDFECDYDEAGSIGKRYRRQDEIGTPYCITIDEQTTQDGTVTIRDRDTMSVHELSFASHNGRDTVKGWYYTPLDAPRGIIQLIHGFGEHSRRYLHMAQLQDSVSCALALAPDHLSLYSLTIEPGTVFAIKGLRPCRPRSRPPFSSC